MSKKILVVVAHADDETLGCGGTIARHVAQGDEVHVVILADGVTSRLGSDDADFEMRQKATKQALDVLGVSGITQLGLPDNCLDSIPLLQAVQPLETVIQNAKPEIIYTHHYGDLNVDHRITHQAVMTACRPLPGHSVKEIYTFEVMSSTEWYSPSVLAFTPQVFVDITDYIDTKMRALSAYDTEIRPAPHSRSYENMRALATYRGHCAGMFAAEAFMVMRILK